MAFYNYHPKSSVTLGKAFDNREPYDDKTKTGFYEFVNQTEIENPIGASVEFEMSEITDKKTFFEKLSIDVSVEAKFSLFNGDASLNWEREVSFSETSLVYVFSARKTYLETSIEGDLRLSAIGKEILNNKCSKGKILDFLNASGTEVVTRITKGNLVSIVYIFSFTNRESRENLKTQLGIQWTSGSLNFDFQKYQEEHDEHFSLIVKGIQSNISGESPLDSRISEIINKDPGNTTLLKSIFKSILEEINVEDQKTAPIVNFKTTALTNIPEIIISDCYTEVSAYLDLSQAISEQAILLRSALLEVNHKLEIAEKYKGKAIENPSIFQKDALDILNDLIGTYLKIKSTIKLNFNNLVNINNLTEIQQENHKIPEIDFKLIVKQPFIILKSWDTSVQFNCANQRAWMYVTIYPHLNILFPEIVFQIDLITRDLNNTNEKLWVSFFKQDINEISLRDDAIINLWPKALQNYSGLIYCWGCLADQQRNVLNTYVAQCKEAEATRKYILKVHTISNEIEEVNLNAIISKNIRITEEMANLNEKIPGNTFVPNVTFIPES